MDLDNGYRKYIDVNSFVDFFIVNEVAKNIDGYVLSTFFFKDKDSKGGKLTMGPVWDFNLAFGNANYREGFLTDGFQVEINQSPWWWGRLLQDSVFEKQIKNRYCKFRDGLLSDNRICSTIDSLSVLLDEAQQRNFEKWDIMDHEVWPNYYVGKSYKDEINFLKTWVFDRLHWLDDSLNCCQGNFSDSTNIETNVYPNPFSNNFTYSFYLNKPGVISIILYNINGVQVAKIVDDVYSLEGEFSINWNSYEIPSSMYFVVLKINGETISREKIIKL